MIAPDVEDRDTMRHLSSGQGHTSSTDEAQLGVNGLTIALRAFLQLSRDVARKRALQEPILPTHSSRVHDTESHGALPSPSDSTSGDAVVHPSPFEGYKGSGDIGMAVLSA